jgi:hypothetical protein
VRLYVEAACAKRWPFAICARLSILPPTAQEFLGNPQTSDWTMDIPSRAAVRDEEGTSVTAAPCLAGSSWRTLRSGTERR